MDVMADVVGARPWLLLLDNCEHVIGASAGLADVLLRTCPKLRILATSREPLRVAGETTWRVPSLSLPPANAVSLDQVADSEAAMLFVERAQAQLPEFAINDRNAAAVTQLCRKLDGIPLGLELAAARVPALALDQIAERLEDALALLTIGSRFAPARHQTLRATLDWSYGLLAKSEQHLLERLSVFAGGWTLEAAEAICADRGIKQAEVLDGLAGLVAKSLVLAERHDNGSARYRLLETIRQYGQGKLAKDAEADTVGQRHAEFFITLAEQLQPEILGSDAKAALDRLESEQDNLRGSFHWLLERGEAEQAQRLAGALGRFWQLRCHFAEGQAWAKRALAIATTVPPTAERARCLYAFGNLTGGRGDMAEAEAANREALAIWRALRNAAEEGWTLFALGQDEWRRGDYSAARTLLQESLSVSYAAGQIQAEINALMRLADVAFDIGDDVEAEARAEAALSQSIARAREALHFMRDVMATASDNLTLTIVFRTAPPAPFVPETLHGQAMVALVPFHAGPLEEGQRVVDQIRAFGPPAADVLGPLPYTAQQRMVDEGCCLGGRSISVGSLAGPERRGDRHDRSPRRHRHLAAVLCGGLSLWRGR